MRDLRTSKYILMIIGLSVLLVLALAIHFRTLYETRRLYELRVDMILLGDQLRQSSDDLTRMARGYVSTTNPDYKKHYQQILNTRDGRTPRPDSNDGFYYDLVMANISQPDLTAPAAPLLNLMRQAGYSEEELALLQLAKTNSDKLTQIEFNAMALTDTVHSKDYAMRFKAIGMLYTPAYFQAKASIMQPIAEVYDRVTERLQNRLNINQQITDRLEICYFIITMLFLCMLYAMRKSFIRASKEKLLNESLFRSVFDNAAIGLAQIDPTGRFLQVNREFSRIFGYTLNEIRASEFDLQSLIKPENPEEELTHFETLRSGYIGEKQCRRKDGRVIWCMLRVHVQHDEAGKPDYLIAVLSEITERKRTELLRDYMARTFGDDNEPFFRGLISQLTKSLDMFYGHIGILDNDGENIRTLAVWCDGHFEDNYSYTLKNTPCGNLLGKTICCFASHVCALFPNNEKLHEIHAESYIGTTLFNHAGEPIGVISIVGRTALENRFLAENLLQLASLRAAGELERLLNQQALSESEQHFRTLANSGSALIWTSGQDKLCNYFNTPWLRFTGRTLEQELGNGWLESVYQDDLDDCLQTYVTAFDQRRSFSMEYRLRHANGEYRWIRDDGCPRYSAQDMFLGYIGYCFDIHENKRNEEQLRKFSLAVAQSPNIIVITDLDANIEYVNQAFVDCTGYSKEEVIGKNPRILKSHTTPDSTYASLWATLHSGQSWEGELFNRRKDGVEFIERAIISPLRQPDGFITHYVAVKNDITELRAATEALKAYRTKLEMMVEERTDTLVQQNLFLEDLVSTIPCGVFRFKQALPPVEESGGDKCQNAYSLELASNTYLRLLATNREEVEVNPLGIVDRIHHEGRDSFNQLFEKTCRELSPLTWEGRMIIKNSIRWMQIDIIPRQIHDELVITGILIDVSERIRQRDLLYRSAIEASPDAFIAIDEQDHIIEWSLQAECLFGYTAAEAAGQCLANLIFPPSYAGEHAYHIHHYDENYRSEIIGKRRRTFAKRRNGTEFPIELQIMAQKINDHWRFTSFIRDISEVTIAEEKLAQSQKLEAIGHLTGGLAHDFNNILGIIIGNLDLMHTSSTTDEIREMCETAMSAANRGGEITKSLLAVARRSSREPTLVDINSLLAEISPLLQQSVGKRIQLTITGSARQSYALLDIGGFNNALLNATINARDAMPDGGDMLIYSYSTLFETAHAEELGLDPGRYIVIGIDDTGIGMSKEVASQAFDPFFTTKRHNNQGTGLGLAMIWGFCRQSGGSAHIVSTPGKGTSLQLMLPIKTVVLPAQSLDNSKKIKSKSEITRKGVILVVDDEKDLTKIVAYWLMDLGCVVEIAHNAEDALSLLAQQHFDVLLSDIIMPGNLDGLGLARETAKQFPNMPVILMSGLAENMSEEDRAHWPLLNKPLNKNALYKAVNRVLMQIEASQ